MYFTIQVPKCGDDSTMSPAVHPPPDTYTKIPFLQDSIGGVGGGRGVNPPSERV